jgi:hypothetical protein
MSVRLFEAYSLTLGGASYLFGIGVNDVIKK